MLVTEEPPIEGCCTVGGPWPPKKVFELFTAAWHRPSCDRYFVLPNVHGSFSRHYWWYTTFSHQKSVTLSLMTALEFSTNEKGISYYTMIKVCSLKRINDGQLESHGQEELVDVFESST